MLQQYLLNPLDQSSLDAADAEIAIKTKPPGSLGRIEELARQISAIQKTTKPIVDPAHLFLFAGDHGLTQEGVSAWPSEVTTQMVANFLAQGAAANAFAKANSVDMTIIDAGIIGDLPDHENLVRANIRKGTANCMHEDAMTQNELEQVLNFSAELASKQVQNGTKTILLGEMGIGNTSSATLLTHAVTGIAIETLTGPGAGLDDKGVTHKTEILLKTAARVSGKLTGMDALRSFGGLEIAMMAGAAIGAASRGALILVDGFIASSAALCALQDRPELAPYLVFAHRSKEPGHRAMMKHIGVDPLIDLDLRLGEGTGALLAFPLIRCAAAMLCDMATFESANVSSSDK